MGEAHVDDRARSVGLAETVAQVHEQCTKARRDSSVEETVNNLIGLLQAIREEEEELHGELRTALYNLGKGGFPYYGHPDAGERFGEEALPASLVEAKLAEDASVLQEGDGGLLVCAVDLVQAHRAREEEVELSAGISRTENDVPTPEGPLGYPDAFSLEIFETKVPGGRGGSGILSKHLPTPLSNHRIPASCPFPPPRTYRALQAASMSSKPRIFSIPSRILPLTVPSGMFRSPAISTWVQPEKYARSRIFDCSGGRACRASRI